MGYSTDFLGCFKCTPKLTEPQRAYLDAFGEKRHFKRRTRKGQKAKWIHWYKLSINEPVNAQDLPDPLRIAVGLPIGKQGAYFTGGVGFCGQDDDAATIDTNQEPDGMPSLWCQWRPDATGEYIGWDGGEKFYRATDWLKYIIENFLVRFGVTLHGVVRYQGEGINDFGSIVCAGNVVEQKPGVKLKPTHPKVMARESCLIWRENHVLDSVKALMEVRKRHG